MLCDRYKIGLNPMYRKHLHNTVFNAAEILSVDSTFMHMKSPKQYHVSCSRNSIS